MRQITVIRNGKKYRVNVPDGGDGDLTNTGGPGGSMTFGLTNQFLSIAGGYSFIPRTGSYTVEWFQYAVENPTNDRIFTIGVWPTAELGVSIENFSGVVRMFLWEDGLGNVPAIANSASVRLPYTNSWHHFAVVRSSGSYIQMFQDGLAIKTITDKSSVYLNADISSSLPLIIGGEGDNITTTMFSGSLTDFRFTNGYALYSQSYTIPTMPIGIGPGTTLLLLAQGPSAISTDLSGLYQPVVKNSVSWSSAGPF